MPLRRRLRAGHSGERVCRWSCAGGCHVNQTYPGAAEAYNRFCVQTRIVTACLLLRSMGLESTVDELLADPEAMRRLADQPWDGLSLDRAELETPSDLGRPVVGDRKNKPRSLVSQGVALLG